MSRQADVTVTGSTRPWPAERIERWAIERLTPYAENARLHSAADIDGLAHSLRRWGWTNPVLVDEAGVLICGHGRVRAAVKLGLSSVPVMVARGWSEEEKRAYRLADNQLTVRGSWDLELLGKELQEIGSGDFDLGLIGFEPDRLARILAGLPTSGLTDRDSVPAVPDRLVSRPGDIWLLGEQRVGCGDSTNAADVTAVLAGSKPHLMVTDPPPDDDRADWQQAYALFPGDAAYVWCRALHDVVTAGLTACGFRLRAQIIWIKQHSTSSHGDYRCKHEVCWYVVRDGKTTHWRGDRRQATVWEFADDDPFGNGQEDGWEHLPRKPIECMRRPIVNNSRPGEAIYDPFLGSGATVIAAEMSGRVCYGLDADPRHVDNAVRRWQAFTGRFARHQVSGQLFDERAAAEPSSIGNQPWRDQPLS